MTMHQLVIDESKCVECGNCYNILGDSKDIFRKSRFLLISENNREANKDLINKALNKCFLDALELKEYTVQGVE